MAVEPVKRLAVGTGCLKRMSKKSTLAELSKATLRRGDRVIWSGLDFTIDPGEFIAVLGPNGAGKTSLIKVLLGQLLLSEGAATVLGHKPGTANRQVGYIPQQKNFDANLPIRGRDLVKLGLDGNRWGVNLPFARDASQVNAAIATVGSASYADMPIGLLSGGEQQRMRIAQAIVSQPKLLLCDEPLLSLDLASQQQITALLDTYRKANETAVLFVTHEVNPILPYVDKVLYIANGRWVADRPEIVLTSATLSQLYGVPIEVITVRNRLIVVGADDTALASPGAHHGVRS